MIAERTQDCVHFVHDGRLAGVYALGDPFKPHVSQLLTPAGHPLAIVSPGDHRHHKGLMYGLKTPEVNFWEEDPGSGACGVQEVLDAQVTENRLVHSLLWREEGGGWETYREQRTIEVTAVAAKQAYLWTWTSEREALRDHRLIHSPWALKLPDGRSINYHGLGLRLPWSWNFPVDAFTGITIAGQSTPHTEACGGTVPEIRWWGRIDGYWDPPIASVTLAQEQQDTWFVLKGDFAYLAVGPSNGREVDVARGERFTERYRILVRDESDR